MDSWDIPIHFELVILADTQSLSSLKASFTLSLWSDKFLMIFAVQIEFDRSTFERIIKTAGDLSLFANW